MQTARAWPNLPCLASPVTLLTLFLPLTGGFFLCSYGTQEEVGACACSQPYVVLPAEASLGATDQTLCVGIFCDGLSA